MSPLYETEGEVHIVYKGQKADTDAMALLGAEHLNVLMHYAPSLDGGKASARAIEQHGVRHD